MSALIFSFLPLSSSPLLFPCFAGGIAQQYKVNKYPTLKLLRNGELVKREFRGQRSVEALAAFLKEQLIEVVSKVPSIGELDQLDVSNARTAWHAEDTRFPSFSRSRIHTRMLTFRVILLTATNQVFPMAFHKMPFFRQLTSNPNFLYCPQYQIGHTKSLFPTHTRMLTSRVILLTATNQVFPLVAPNCLLSKGHRLN